MRNGNRVACIVGPDPKPNTICLEVAKCCDNCNLFHFGYGRNGKRITGYCGFTRQCVLSHNTCSRWYPVNNDTYGNNLKSSISNLGCGVDRYVDKDISQFNYTKDMHDDNKKMAEKLKQNYRVGINNFEELLKAKIGL